MAFNDVGRLARGAGKEHIVIRKKQAQIARHAAIVLAGAASLSLTVVAGSYIVHQIADLNRPGGDIAAPPAQAVEDSTSDGAWTDTVLTGGHHGLPVAFTRHPLGVAVPTPKAAAPHTDSAFVPHQDTVAAKLRLGDAYLDAQVTAVRTDTISVTVGTNAFTVLTGHPQEHQGITQLRTEFDTRSGEVVLMLTDPALGDHDLRLNRAPAPNPKPAPDTRVSTTTPEPAATDHAIASGASAEQTVAV
ncbi:hypothetical protein OG203_25420 [Nocardia sp. NBC_01499]|uniref:hypothetical protein n=1 Tax=Nocardia sp. NBC_01499 TaxID=2903597 RepID=UPI00386C7AF3